MRFDWLIDWLEKVRWQEKENNSLKVNQEENILDDVILVHVTATKWVLQLLLISVTVQLLWSYYSLLGVPQNELMESVGADLLQARCPSCQPNKGAIHL